MTPSGRPWSDRSTFVPPLLQNPRRTRGTDPGRTLARRAHAITCDGGDGPDGRGVRAGGTSRTAGRMSGTDCTNSSKRRSSYVHEVAMTERGGLRGGAGGPSTPAERLGECGAGAVALGARPW